MPSANKDRVTMSLHLDKRVYALLKRCSAFEKQPMSRIVDQQLSLYVEKYGYDTMEESELGERYRLEELARQEEIQAMTYEPSREDELTIIANSLASLEKDKKAPQDAIRQLREYYLENLSEAEKKRIEQIKTEQKAESDRWKEIAKQYPLP